MGSASKEGGVIGTYTQKEIEAAKGIRDIAANFLNVIEMAAIPLTDAKVASKPDLVMELARHILTCVREIRDTLGLKGPVRE